VNLAWADLSGAETGYEVERGIGCPATSYELLARLPVNATSFQDKTAQPETTYSYRVRAVNDNGASDYSLEVCITTAPWAPSGVAGESLSPSRVHVTWTDVASVEDGYEIRRALASNGLFNKLATLPPGATEYLDETATQETDYNYDVTAFDGNGLSTRVETEEFRTPAVLVARKASIKRGKNGKPSKLVLSGEFDIGGTWIDLADAATFRIGNRVIAISAFEAKGKGFRYQDDEIRIDLKPGKGTSRVKFKLQATGALVDAIDPDAALTISFTNGDFLATGTIGLAGDKFQPGKLGEWLDPAFNIVSLGAKLKGAKGALVIKAAFHAPGGVPDEASEVVVTLGYFTFRAPANQFKKKGDRWLFSQKVFGARKITLDYKKGLATISLKGVAVGSYPTGPIRVRVGVEFAGVRFEDTPEMTCTGKSLKY